MDTIAAEHYNGNIRQQEINCRVPRKWNVRSSSDRDKIFAKI